MNPSQKELGEHGKNIKSLGEDHITSSHNNEKNEKNESDKK